MKNPATRARSGSSGHDRAQHQRKVEAGPAQSCAAIMTAVRIAVATRPNSAQPAQSMRLADRELVGLGVERVEHVLERLVEAGDALVFEGETDIVHVDADGDEVAHHVVRVVDI